jgi:hypothetical protein
MTKRNKKKRIEKEKNRRQRIVMLYNIEIRLNHIKFYC